MQGIRGAVPQDLAAIQALLLPLEQKGILAPRSDAQLLSDLRFFRVAERDANVSTNNSSAHTNLAFASISATTACHSNSKLANCCLVNVGHTLGDAT